MNRTERGGNTNAQMFAKCSNFRILLCRPLPGAKPLWSTILFSPHSCRRPVEGEGEEEGGGGEEVEEMVEEEREWEKKSEGRKEKGEKRNKKKERARAMEGGEEK